MPALFAVRRSATSTFRQAGAKVSYDEPYPGWKPNPDSAILARTAEVYEQLFGEKPEIKAIHAGLECGLILEKVPGMDAVSIGPQIENAHSPDECVQISSTAKFYKHVAALLEDLA
jgi:dipeptidase D